MNKNIFSWLFSFMGCTLMVGCAPHYSKYQYIEPIDEVSRVIEQGKSEVSGLKKHKLMPIRHELARDKYLIYLDVDVKSFWPSVYITVESSGKKLSLQRAGQGQCGGFYSYPYRESIDDKVNELRYEWSPPFFCPYSAPDDSPKIISFSVFDGDELIAQEELHFSLIENGWVVSFDAI